MTDSPKLFLFTLRQWPCGHYFQRAFELPDSAMDIALAIFGDGPELRIFEALPEKEEPTVNKGLTAALTFATQASFSDSFVREHLGGRRRMTFHFNADEATFRAHAEHDGYTVCTMAELLDVRADQAPPQTDWKNEGLLDWHGVRRARWDADGDDARAILERTVREGGWHNSYGSRSAYLLAETTNLEGFFEVARALRAEKPNPDPNRWDEVPRGDIAVAQLAILMQATGVPAVARRFTALYASKRFAELFNVETLQRVASVDPSFVDVSGDVFERAAEGDAVSYFQLVWELVKDDNKAKARHANHLRRALER